MSLTKIIVNLKTYEKDEHVVQTLKNLYYKEHNINARLNVDTPLEISYYGLELTIKELDDSVKSLEKIRNYIKELRDRYKSYQYTRQAHGVKQVHRFKTGIRINDAIKLAIHLSRESIQQAQTNDLNWCLWKFYYVFNSEEYEFNPLSPDCLAKTKREYSRSFATSV